MTIKRQKYPQSKNYGSLEVVEEFDSKNCTVRFLNTGTVRYGIRMGQIRSGTVKDPYAPKVYGVGFVGEGKFSPTEHKKLYKLWTAMLQRCYDDKYGQRYPTYIGCSVVRKWHCFQNFAADIVKMKNWNTPGFELDKDLRIFGNKKYGPKYCSFVPNEINAIFRGDNAKGYSKCKDGPMYESKLRMDGKLVHLGRFTTSKEAAKVFRQRKSSYVNRKAKQLRKVLHPEVYATLRGYK